jgi:hypothetical protein
VPRAREARLLRLLSWWAYPCTLARPAGTTGPEHMQQEGLPSNVEQTKLVNSKVAHLFFSLLVHPRLQSLSRVHAEARAARTPPACACISCAHVGPTRGPHWDHSCSYRFSRASHVQHLIYFQTSRCNTYNIQNKTDETIETCVSNT